MCWGLGVIKKAFLKIIKICVSIMDNFDFTNFFAKKFPLSVIRTIEG